MTANKPLGAWTDAENDILAAAYLDMLASERAGEKYNKAATRREGLAAMASTRSDGRARSAGSWEMKACNASAVMHAAGLRFINGYKPLGHGQQRALAAALIRQLEQRADCDAIALAAIDKLREIACDNDT